MACLIITSCQSVSCTTVDEPTQMLHHHHHLSPFLQWIWSSYCAFSYLNKCTMTQSSIVSSCRQFSCTKSLCSLCLALPQTLQTLFFLKIVFKFIIQNSGFHCGILFFYLFNLNIIKLNHTTSPSYTSCVTTCLKFMGSILL